MQILNDMWITEMKSIIIHTDNTSTVIYNDGTKEKFTRAETKLLMEEIENEETNN